MPDSNAYPPVITNNLNATIASSASLSSPADLSGTTLCGYIMPASWTSADITFQASIDGSTYYDLHDNFGNEVNHSVAAGKFITLNPADFACVRYLKIRSGTSAAAVNQAAERIINLITRSV